MKIKCDQFRVAPKSEVKLKECPTLIKAPYKSKYEYLELLAQRTKDLSDLQDVLNANATYSMLLIFQAMDAGGKDSMIKHVMSGVNPQGCDVYSFKTPNNRDRAHDFLWRTNRCLPERGKIGIFNRSYYEEVLIVRVHPEILQSQQLPAKLKDKKTIWKERFDSIRDMEKHLSRNGTVILKFYLHISQDEQRNRFLSRIDEPAKNWKITPADIEERDYWKDYMKANEEAINATSTEDSPWYIIPGDDKPTARLLVSEILVDKLASLKLSYPITTTEHRKELLVMRKTLEK